MALKPLFGFSGRRFGVEPVRLVRVFLGIAAIYAAGIGMAGWAAALTAKVMHSGGDALPYAQWLGAFVIIIAGFLAVVYGIFFRPRELRVSEDEVKLVLWDGSGKFMKRVQLESFDATPSRLVLRGGGKTLVVGKMFEPWNEVRAAVENWARAGKT
jgi:hypothetical protein